MTFAERLSKQDVATLQQTVAALEEKKRKARNYHERQMCQAAQSIIRETIRQKQLAAKEKSKEIRESLYEELSGMSFLKSHSRHIVSGTLVFAPNETTNQAKLQEQDNVRVLRFDS